MVESNTSEEVQSAIQLLKECEQTHILDEFSKRSHEEQQAMAKQVIHLDKVTPGGLKDYTMRARRFLENSKNGVNPFDQYKPEIPHGFDLKPGEPLYDEMEELGL